MNIKTIILGVFAIAKAFPIVNSWIDRLVKAWSDKGIQESDDVRTEIQQEKEALNRAIAKADNDKDIRLLSITLRRLTSGKLPVSEDTSKIL